MIIVDTSVWIHFLRKSDPEIYHMLKKYLQKGQAYALSFVFGELLQGTKNKREKELIQMLWEDLPKLEERDLFILAGILSGEHGLHHRGIGLIDCAILAAAVKFDTALWTLDKNLNKAYHSLA